MDKSEFDFPTVVPLDHDAEIGRVARGWGHLEYMIDLTIWDTAEVDQRYGACITAQIISATYKLRCLLALVRLRGGSAKLCADLDGFQGSIFGLLEKRNRAVHDPRFARESTGEIVRWQTTATPKEIHFGPKAETVDDVKAVRVKIRATISKFMRLRERIAKERASWIDKSPPPRPMVIPL